MRASLVSSLIGAAVLFGSGGSAHAQVAPPPVDTCQRCEPVLAPPSWTSPMPVEPPPQPTGRRKNPRVALGLSLGITIGSTVALSALAQTEAGETGEAGFLAVPALIGTMIGPSVGHWYSGRVVNRGMGIRAVGALTASLGLGMVMGCVVDEIIIGADNPHPERNDDDCTMPAIVLIAGAATYIGGTIYEIADAPRAAREYNRRHGWDVSLVPTASAQGGGVSLRGRF